MYIYTYIIIKEIYKYLSNSYPREEKKKNQYKIFECYIICGKNNYEYLSLFVFVDFIIFIFFSFFFSIMNKDYSRVKADYIKKKIFHFLLYNIIGFYYYYLIK